MTKYKFYTRQQTGLHTIKGSNCNTEHVVPEYLNEALVHALMNFAFGSAFLSDQIEHVRGRVHLKNLKNAFILQSLGIVYIDGFNVKLQKEYLPLIKRLKLEGWYYWVGPDTENLDNYLNEKVGGKI